MIAPPPATPTHARACRAMPRVARVTALLLAAGLMHGCAGAQPVDGAAPAPVSVSPRPTVALPASTTDQNGLTFTITGLSGIAYLGPVTPGGVPGDGAPHEFIAVMDNSNKLVRLRLTFTAAGAVATATVTGGLSMAVSRDFEGIAPGRRDAGGAVTSVLLAEETTPAVVEVRLSDGALLRTLPTPPIFASRRANFGFESLAAARGVVWTCNEEALSGDGPLSTPTAGTTVRLLRLDTAGDAVIRSRQFAYTTQPMHGAAISGARSGVSELILLPDSRVLTLERSFALGGTFFQTRLYEVGLAGATDVSGVSSLTAGGFTPATKRLVWQGNLNNLEGLCLGPRLTPPPGRGTWALVGVVDDADPISTNALAVFALTGLDPAAPAPSGGTATATRK